MENNAVTCSEEKKVKTSSFEKEAKVFFEAAKKINLHVLGEKELARRKQKLCEYLLKSFVARPDGVGVLLLLRDYICDAFKGTQMSKDLASLNEPNEIKGELDANKSLLLLSEILTFFAMHGLITKHGDVVDLEEGELESKFPPVEERMDCVDYEDWFSGP